MTYPNFVQTSASTEDADDGVSFDRASNGALRGRAMWSAPRPKFRIRHLLQTADKETLRAFYEANRAATFDFLWSGDGEIYEAAFSGPPKYIPQGGGWWQCDVEMITA